MEKHDLKVSVVSDGFGTKDEGIKNFAISLSEKLRDYVRELQVLSILDIKPSLMRKTLLSVSFLKKLSLFEPNLIIYIPRACETVFSFYRAWLLRNVVGAKLFLISLQRRKKSIKFVSIFRLPKPDKIVVFSVRRYSELIKLGYNALHLVPPLDLSKFSPVSDMEKISLRKKLNLPLQQIVVLHVGHLTKGRNLESLIRLKKLGVYPLLIASNAFPHDPEIKHKLHKARIRIVEGYISHIQQYYQAADIYMFPVVEENRAIDFPLSVLEAMAVNIPVISTPFGAIPEYFHHAPQDGFFLFNPADGDEMLEAYIKEAISLQGKVRNREKVINFSWENLISKLLEAYYNGLP